MNLKNKTLALVVASALVMPSAIAVEGSDGMHYTSAGEGFYTSIRVNFNSGKTDGDNAGLGNQSSRLGVQGTSEMSHGLEGFYRYEAGFDIDNGSDISTRMGSCRSARRLRLYRGRHELDGRIQLRRRHHRHRQCRRRQLRLQRQLRRRTRQQRSIFYTSPDFNGLQVAARLEVDGGNENENDQRDGAPAGTPDAELDAWALSAKYAFSGFTVGGMYLTRPDYINANVDATGTMQNIEDLSAWALRGSYGQDNWGVSTWYGENNVGDFGYHVADPAAVTAGTDMDFKKSNETVFSIAGNVAVGPTGVYVIHETQENLKGEDDAYTTFGVQYNFNSKAKTWIEYNAQDAESNDGKEDFVSIGLRHDF